MMSDYLDSLRNTEGTGIDYKNVPNSDLDSISTIKDVLTLSAITSGRGEGMFDDVMNELLPYMQPQKVTVKRYRLKK